MTQTAVSFILGASLSAGWVGAFSKATDDLKGLSENLKRGSAALDAFSASREKMENASAALRRFFRQHDASFPEIFRYPPPQKKT